MKHKILALATGLSLAAFSANAIAQNLATPPTPENKDGAPPPCGNSGPTDPSPCNSCGNKDSTGTKSLPVGSACDVSSINSSNGNAHRKITDLTFTRRMTWGLDLSQSLQGAGGVGGLVMVEELPSGGGAPVPSFPTYDGNGNITAWVNASGTVVARQRYDAYGNIIEQTGTAPSNYGFSTKPMDQVTGLLYYGYRYYDPATGRWPSRDPIGEKGGINMYGFVRNDGGNYWDILGLKLPQAGYRPVDGYNWMGSSAIFWHAFIKFPDGTTDSNLGKEKTTSNHTRYVDGVKITDKDRSLEDGTTCDCATDEKIVACVRDSMSTCSIEGFPFSNNCGSNVRDAFTSCCLKDPTPSWLWYPGGNN